MLLPDGSQLTLPPTEHLQVRLRFTESATFHFLHGGVIHGLLSRHIDHPLPKGLVPFAPESGKVRFRQGDSYIFGITATGDARGAGPRLEDELRRAGSHPRRAGRTLDGNYRFEALETVPAVTRDEVLERARALAERSTVELQFLSPLRLELPTEGRGPRKGFVNADRFPPDLLLQRLWQRWCLLSRGVYPKRSEMPDAPRGLTADARHLTWLDLPVRGRNGKPGRPKGMTLGGVVGTVRLEGLTPDWCLLLAAMQPYHVGKAVLYGCGRYRLPEVSSLEDEPFRPASNLLRRSLKPAIEQMLSDCSFAYQSGYSRESASRVMHRAFDAGFRHVLEVDLGSLLAPLGGDRDRILARLEALFPFEPWGTIFQQSQGSTSFQKRFGALVARLFLREMDELLGPDERLIRMGDDFVVLSKTSSARPARYKAAV